jgi:hypothetical protein
MSFCTAFRGLGTFVLDITGLAGTGFANTGLGLGSEVRAFGAEGRRTRGCLREDENKKCDQRTAQKWVARHWFSEYGCGCGSVERKDARDSRARATFSLRKARGRLR